MHFDIYQLIHSFNKVINRFPLITNLIKLINLCSINEFPNSLFFNNKNINYYFLFQNNIYNGNKS
jgi:hypothetical protein